MPSRKRIFVLDTSAILAGFQSSLPGAESYTTQLVISEARRKLAQEKREDNLDIGSLIVMEPSLETIESVILQASKMGESANLSSVDISILSLAKQLSQDPSNKVEILSNDYSIQNMSNAMGLAYYSFGTQRIKKEINWVYYCKGCRRKYQHPPKRMNCVYCGSQIIRKPRDTRHIKP
jgi:rRNA maturation endonuclease Nob1